MTALRLAILISGRGSNMQALVRAGQGRNTRAEPVLVVSNRPHAAGLVFAEQAGLKHATVDHTHFGKDREAFERALHKVLLDADIDFIALAGFMRILTPWFIRHWRGRMINIHPSLLPKYPGLNTHKRALEAGDSEAGCSVHWVSEGVDMGEIIAQARVPIKPGDTEDSLAGRVLAQEHILYPKALETAVAQIKRRRDSD